MRVRALHTPGTCPHASTQACADTLRDGAAAEETQGIVNQGRLEPSVRVTHSAAGTGSPPPSEPGADLCGLRAPGS